MSSPGQISTPNSYPNQGRSVASIASLYLFRMLGLFMVLPVLALYGQDYLHSTPFLLGLALGAYGFSQAILQIPFGWWSDNWGRRPVIAVGLLLFAIGSLIAALSDSVYGLILGRFLQGCGAIAGALMALVADSTSDQHRSKAMAVIGVSIGVSFSIALILGPILTEWAGLSGIFWFTVVLALVGIGILYLAVPEPNAERSHRSTERSSLKNVLANKELLRLDWGILVLHMVLMANFVVVPGLLENVVGIDRAQHWWVYLPLLLGAFVVMMPFMLLGERKGKLKVVFLGAIALLIGVELSLTLITGLNANAYSTLILAALFAFFVAFNLLEATLPSQVSKMSPISGRGSASGVYSSAQFLGAFMGGTIGGAAFALGGATLVFGLNALALISWLIFALPMVVKPPQSEMGENSTLKTGETKSVEKKQSDSGKLSLKENRQQEVELDTI